MAHKCEVCKEKIGVTFLQKILGVVVKDKKGKQHYFCSTCQQKLGNNKEDLLSQK